MPDGARVQSTIAGSVLGRQLPRNAASRLYVEWDDHFGDGWYDESQLEPIPKEE